MPEWESYVQSTKLLTMKCYFSTVHTLRKYNVNFRSNFRHYEHFRFNTIHHDELAIKFHSNATHTIPDRTSLQNLILARDEIRNRQREGFYTLRLEYRLHSLNTKTLTNAVKCIQPRVFFTSVIVNPVNIITLLKI